jgi:hypothetical protein
MKHIISLGAGVQSSTMALMAKHGLIEPMPECAVFADTQSEPQNVYRWLDWLETQLPFPVIRVTKGNLGVDASKEILSKNGNYYSAGDPPLWVLNDNGKPSIIMRQCTQHYKIKVIQKQIKRLRSNVTQWIGISLDELHRMKTSREDWIINRYPLIDMRMTRGDCLEWMKSNNYPEPPRSACVFCPYQKDSQWLKLKTEYPDDFDVAVQFEKRFQAMKKKDVRFKGVPFLHKSLKPICEVDFDPNANQADLFGNECEGMCGV